MESFHWDSSYLTGLPTVDTQHHRLVDLINDLGEQVAERALTESALATIFGELTDYASYHFTEEEALMAEMRLDERHIVLHCSLHQRFLTDVTRLYGEIKSPGAPEVEHLLDYLVNWLAFHILGEDQNMAHQVAAVQSGQSAAGAYEAFERTRDDSKTPLLRALHSLFDQVSARNRSLEALNDHLEELVAERTAELAEANRKLEQIALTDQMTGLPNRRHAMEVLESLWAAGRALSCLMIDADHFKEINDGFGHKAGDAVIRRLGACLQQAVRTEDFVSRLGGDEYLVVCPGTGREAALQLAEHLRVEVNALRVPVQAGNGTEGIWHGSVSIGVASRRECLDTPLALVAAADAGVYLAKDAGKNCVRMSA